MYCNRCGKPIPDGSTFCNACGAPQGQPQRPVQQRPVYQPPKPLPPAYIAVSWVTFALLLIYGIYLGLHSFNGGEDFEAYKGVALCLAACVFIPQIRINLLDGYPWAVYAIKAGVAALLFFVL